MSTQGSRRKDDMNGDTIGSGESDLIPAEPMSTIRFRPWILRVDVATTKRCYERIEEGGPETCGCDNGIAPGEMPAGASMQGSSQSFRMGVWRTCSGYTILARSLLPAPDNVAER